MWPATKAGRRRFLVGAGALAGYAAIAGLALRQRPPRLYRIGLVGPFEGLFRNDGYDALAVCRDAVAVWNASFGEARVQLQAWAVDDGNDPTVAVRRAHELAGDPLVLAVVGHLTPETSAAAAAVYRDAGLLQVSPAPLPAAPAPDAGPPSLSLGVPPSLARSAGGAAAEYAADGLLELALGLASFPGATSMLLDTGYCSAPLAQTFPDVAFSAVVAYDAPSLPTLVAAAVDLTLKAVGAAVREGPLGRERVHEAAVASAQSEGWVQEGPALYRPGVVPTFVSCPAAPQK